MTRRGAVVAVVLGMWAVPAARAAGPFDTSSVESLKSSLRELILNSLPTPLHENDDNWNKQKWVTNGIVWRGKGIKVHPERQKALKNDGRWWKVRMDALTPRDTLVLDVRDMRRPEDGRLLFTVHLAFDARVEYERQVWESGVRLLSTSARARIRPSATLDCEVTSKVEPGTGPLPDLVFRFRVLKAAVRYDNLKVEHVAGVGGEAAEIIGDAIHDIVNQVKPSLERKLLDKAGEAIVKAGTLKEVRVSLSTLFGKK